jgi:hypothetical protein
MSGSFKVLVSDNISPEGKDILERAKGIKRIIERIRHDTKLAKQIQKSNAKLWTPMHI